MFFIIIQFKHFHDKLNIVVIKLGNFDFQSH